jgi:alcohol dehydrogenase
MPGKKAMLIISNGKSARANGYLARTEEQLKSAGIETVVFDKVEANPLRSTVMEGGVFAKENNCDFIVALGGGSCMDAAKGIAVMATNDGDYWDYVFGGTGKEKPMEHKPLPVIAITTTAGTGSETDPWAVVTHEKNHEKIGYGDDALFPVLAIVDPELMLTVPPKFTAYQGFDALFHSVEGYVSNGANLMSDMYAITAIENIAKNLAKTVKSGNDLDAREKVAFGNTLSGTVMCVGLCTSQHALEHAMSAYHQELPHGAGLIMLSKAYFTHLIDKHVCDDRFVQMAKAMGMEDAKEPIEFITMLVKLQEDCGVADLKMSDYGITPDEFETMAKNAKDTMGFLFTCDRTELSIDDCVAIYEASYK